MVSRVKYTLSNLFGYRLLLCIVGHSSPTKIEITAGAFWRKLSTTVNYEATIPLVYETQWFEHEGNGNEGKKFKGICNQDNDTGSNKINKIECIIIKSLELLENAFEAEFDSLQNAWSTTFLKIYTADEEPDNVRSKRSLDFLGEGLSWCCGVATQHKLDSLTMNENEVREIVSKLNTGLSQSITKITENSKKFIEYENAIRTSFNITETRIHKIEDFINNLKNEILENENKEHSLLLSMLYRQSQNLNHNVHIVRAMRRQGIINSCRQHQLPIAILNPSILSHDLRKLEKELNDNNQGLAIGISQISKYYQLPLCDCTFLEDKVVIHLRVPINKKNISWELFELITTPFRWNEQTCVIEHDTVFLAATKNFQNYETQVRQISGSVLRHCNPYHDKLCYIPRFSGDTVRGPDCAKKLFKGATVDELNYHCPMRCHKSNSLIISEIAEETYILTHPKPITEIKCPNETTILQEKIYTSQGAVKIRIPCNCELVIKNEQLIPKRFPCPQLIPLEMSITHIIPAAWSNLKSYILNPLTEHQPQYLNITESLNTNWTMNIPHLNITTTSDTIREITKDIGKKIEYLYPSEYGMQSDTIFLIWNSVLSGCIAFIIFKQRNPLTLIPNIVGTARASGSNSPVEHDLLFGTLCILLIAFIVYLLVRCLINWRNTLKRTESQGRRNSLKLQEQPNPSKRESENEYVIEVEKKQMSRIKTGQSIACTLRILDDDSDE